MVLVNCKWKQQDIINNVEALEKWTRRVNKINWNDLIIILAENETCNYEIIKQFDTLTFIS